MPAHAARRRARAVSDSSLRAMLRPYPWWSMSATRGPELRARLAGLTLRDEERLARRARRGGDLEAEIAKAEERIARRRAAVPRITYPNLPVSERKDELMAAIRDNQVGVVAGGTRPGQPTPPPEIAPQPRGGA